MEEYHFIIPTWAMCYLEYGKQEWESFEDLTEYEMEKLNLFIEEILPKRGIWEWEEESYFSNCNDITGYVGGEVIDAKYFVV